MNAAFHHQIIVVFQSDAGVLEKQDPDKERYRDQITKSPNHYFNLRRCLSKACLSLNSSYRLEQRRLAAMRFCFTLNYAQPNAM